MIDTELSDLLRAYIEKYGHTFTSLKARLKPELPQMLKDAIAGKRGAITDQDLGFDFPDDANI